MRFGSLRLPDRGTRRLRRPRLCRRRLFHSQFQQGCGDFYRDRQRRFWAARCRAQPGGHEQNRQRRLLWLRLPAWQERVVLLRRRDKRQDHRLHSRADGPRCRFRHLRPRSVLGLRVDALVARHRPFRRRRRALQPQHGVGVHLQHRIRKRRLHLHLRHRHRRLHVRRVQRRRQGELARGGEVLPVGLGATQRPGDRGRRRWLAWPAHEVSEPRQHGLPAAVGLAQDRRRRDRSSSSSSASWLPARP